MLACEAAVGEICLPNQLSSLYDLPMFPCTPAGYLSVSFTQTWYFIFLVLLGRFCLLQERRYASFFCFVTI
jgi:hypothetical protein